MKSDFLVRKPKFNISRIEVKKATYQKVEGWVYHYFKAPVKETGFFKFFKPMLVISAFSQKIMEVGYARNCSTNI